MAKYSKKLSTKICDLLEAGQTVADICKREDIPVTSRTVRNWRRKYPEFNKQYIISYQSYLHSLQDELFDLMAENLPNPKDIVIKYDLDESDKMTIKSYLNAEIQKRRLKIDTLKFAVAKILPRVSDTDVDKTKVEVKGDMGFNFNVVSYKKEDTDK